MVIGCPANGLASRLPRSPENDSAPTSCCTDCSSSVLRLMKPSWAGVIEPAAPNTFSGTQPLAGLTQASAVERVERLSHLGQRAPVATRLRLVRVAAAPVRIIGPVVRDRAFQAEGVLQRLVVEVEVARSQFDEAAVDQQRDDGRIAFDAAGGRDAAARAQLLARGRRNERITDRHIEGAAEGAGLGQDGSDLAAWCRTVRRTLRHAR